MAVRCRRKTSAGWDVGGFSSWWENCHDLSWSHCGSMAGALMQPKPCIAPQKWLRRTVPFPGVWLCSLPQVTFSQGVSTALILRSSALQASTWTVLYYCLRIFRPACLDRQLVFLVHYFPSVLTIVHCPTIQHNHWIQLIFVFVDHYQWPNSMRIPVGT